jgi:membrane protein required for colicin V production
MPIIDILIAVAISASVVVGIIRGFVKESLSIASLLLAIWSALYFGPSVGEISDSWLNSQGAQMWFGRILVFGVVLSLGGLLGWGVSRIVRMSLMNHIDRGWPSSAGSLPILTVTIGGWSRG